EVKESLSIFDTEPAADEAGHHDAARVGKDRDGQDRGHEHDLHPGSWQHQVGPRNPESDQGNQRSDATAGLSDPERDAAQVNDVTVQQNGYTEEIQSPRSRLGGDVLKPR